jgi:hypothetical protein
MFNQPNKQKLIRDIAFTIVIILALFFLYFLESKQFKLTAIVGFLLSFFQAFFFPWTSRIYANHSFDVNSNNSNRSTASDRIFKTRFEPFTTSKKGRMFTMWIVGCFILFIIFRVTYFNALEFNTESELKPFIFGVIIFFSGSFLGWISGLLRDYLAYRKLPKGTIYPDN